MNSKINLEFSKVGNVVHAPTPQALAATSTCLLNPKPLRKANDLSTTVTTLSSNQQRVGKLACVKISLHTSVYTNNSSFINFLFC